MQPPAHLFLLKLCFFFSWNIFFIKRLQCNIVAHLTWLVLAHNISMHDKLFINNCDLFNSLLFFLTWLFFKPMLYHIQPVLMAKLSFWIVQHYMEFEAFSSLGQEQQN